MYTEPNIMGKTTKQPPIPPGEAGAMATPVAKQLETVPWM